MGLTCRDISENSGAQLSNGIGEEKIWGEERYELGVWTQQAQQDDLGKYDCLEQSNGIV